MGDISIAYKAMIDDGELLPDAAQTSALAALERLSMALEGYAPRVKTQWTKLFSPKSMPPKGLYIYGGVGRGKSMLMDLFFNTVKISNKRRVHFHQFMLEVHDRLHKLQEKGSIDVLRAVAGEISSATTLICFDEFHVDNIVDAMVLGRLFEALFASGTIMVSTSNWSPDDLYKNGLQRERFLPFIGLLHEEMTVIHLDGVIDHRFEKTKALESSFSPLNSENTRKLQNIFLSLTENADLEPITLLVQGRSLKMTHASKGVGFFNFDELCVKPLGSADYLAIAVCLHTILIDEIPVMLAEKRNETTRFINLIDALYEAKTKLFFVSEAPVQKLAPEGELNMPFQRTISRLMEMQSAEYRQKPHRLG